jgi:hypothetical protein
VEPRQSEKAVWFAGIDVFQEEDKRLGWLFFSFPAKSALAGFHRLGPGDVAGAGGNVGAERRGQAQYEQDRQPTHFTIIIGVELE